MGKTLSLLAPCLLIAAAVLGVPAQAHAQTAPTDVVFLFDTSGSMEPVLNEAESEIQTVMTRLQGTFPAVEFGVAEAKDVGEEEDGYYAWKLEQPVTSSNSAVSEAIASLYAHGGGDGPEAYGRALYETDTNPSVGWRPGARHLIVLIADQVPHMPNVNESLPEEFWAQDPFNTGEELEDSAGIASTQWHPGVNIQFTEDLKRLVADEKPLEMVDYHDTEGDYIHYWEHWAGLADGSAVEASEGGDELAAHLVSLVERAAVQCATTAAPTTASPGTNGLPSAATPRFGQPGSRLTVIAPVGSQFCPGDNVNIGGADITDVEEASETHQTFRVPPEASSGLGISGPAGLLSPLAPYAVDDFREPWGFSIINSLGNGNKAYDYKIAITRQDLESVFAGLGGPGTAAYKEAEDDAESVLDGGLCYGFTLLSWEMYLDTHGNSLPLGWASSPGFGITGAQQPIALPEAASGPHGLTHALMRAAISQFSPEAEARFTKIHSAAELASQLGSGFSRSQPVPLNIHWSEGGFLGIGAERHGHAMLAFNDQPAAGGGLVVDVVDPNVPAWASPQTIAFSRLQIHVNANGSWSFLGSFEHGTYGDPLAEGSGTIETAPDIRVPGALNITANVHHWWDIFAPRGGAKVTALSYGSASGHGFPGDVREGAIAEDTAIQRLLVPPGHQVVTATVEGGTGGSAHITGSGFIDSASLGTGTHTVTLDSSNGGLAVQQATSKTKLDVTKVSGGTQYTAEVSFTGHVTHARVTVSSTGDITLATAGGSGSASVRAGTYLRSGRRSVSKHSRIALHGPAHLHRHTPKVKRHKSRKPRKRR